MERQRRVLIAAGIAIAVALGVGVLHQAGGSPAERGLEGWTASTAFALAFAGPSISALVTYRRAPRTLIGIGAGLFLMSLASIATWPLLIPGGIYVAAGFEARDTRNTITGIVIGACAVAAFAALFLSSDPRSWSLPTESGSTSDVITYTEALLSLALSAAGIGLAATAAHRTAVAA